jgi:hypothetical protein
MNQLVNRFTQLIKPIVGVALASVRFDRVGRGAGVAAINKGG